MITAIILTKNEEEKIIDCLESVSFCDEVIVIDDESADRTVELAKTQGAGIIKHKLENDFSAQRNFALTQAKNEWVLFVDADETISGKLRDEILSRVHDDSYNGFYIPRHDTLFGRTLKYGELSGQKLIRLGRKNNGKWSGAVHEVWEIQGKVGSLKNPIMHLPHQTLQEFIREVNFYSTLRAQELHKKKVTVSLFSILLYTKGKFFYTYIVKLGFLDGVAGLVVCLMMSFHSFLTRSKLYLLKHSSK